MRYVRGNLQNNRILLKVGLSPFAASGPVGGLSTPTQADFREYSALFDTGALRTCITESVVQDLGLLRRGRATLWNIKRPEPHWTYLVNLGIWPDADEREHPTHFFGLRDGFEVIDVGNHPYFQVLIGMDLLEGGTLEIASDGQFKIGFRD